MSLRVVENSIDVALPFDSVKMLFVQPHLEFQEEYQEPFPLLGECRARLIQSIDKIFEIARTFDPHFILFPEFALPGVEAVRKVAELMANAAVPASRIVIAGVQGLSREQYIELCALPNAHVEAENEPGRVSNHQWVNTSVTFVKDSRGAVSLWIQPKISPSWKEMNLRHQEMFPGRAASIFKAQFENQLPCRFFSLLCFDWVGQECGATVPAAILRQFSNQCGPAQDPLGLHWVFVLQYNDSPNHPTFLNAANGFLSQPEPFFVLRHDTAVVMVSTAHSRRPAHGKPFGYSSVIFGPGAPFDHKACPPTFATQSKRLRGSEALQTCMDAVFREMGECIHTAVVRVPASVVRNPTDRTTSVVEAKTYPLVGTSDDPRIPSAPVPAVVKWVNDELDTMEESEFNGTAIELDLKRSHARTVMAYRHSKSQVLATRVDGACARRVKQRKEGNGAKGIDPAADIDTNWDADERKSLQHVIQCLTMIDCVVALDIDGATLHARYPEKGIEIGAILGAHHADCVPAFKLWTDKTHSPVLFVSRDDNNLAVLPREVEDFTDPGGAEGISIRSAHELFEKARGATEAEYREFVLELLNVPEKRIV